MPTSAHNQISVVLSLCREIAPKRILDIGMGFGKYGVLLREYLDISFERYEEATWQVEIGGIECFAPYENPIWHYVYDWHKIGDVREVLPSLGHFDLILLIDVLEHLERSDGQALISACLERAEYVLVCTPSKRFPQGAFCGNEAEIHRSRWRPGDFGRCRRLTIRRTGQYIFLLSRRGIPWRLRWEYSFAGRCFGVVRAVYRAVLPEPIRKAFRRLLLPIIHRRRTGSRRVS